MKFKYKNERERKLKKGAIIAGGAAAGIGLVAAGRKAGPKLVEMAKNEVYARAAGRNKQIREALAAKGKIALASYNKADVVFEKIAKTVAGKMDMTDYGGFKTKKVLQLKTPLGKRYYEGTGESKDRQFSSEKAEYDAMSKFKNNPSDSLSTQDFNKKYMSKKSEFIMSKLAQNEVDRKTTTTTEGNTKTTTTKSKATLTGVRDVGTPKRKRIGQGFRTDQAIQLNTPDGKRYYEGIGRSRDIGFSRDKARFDAMGKYMNTPSDSLTTQDFNKKYMSKKSEFIMNKYAGVAGTLMKGIAHLSGKARRAAIEAHNKAVAKSGKFKNVNIKDSAGKNVVKPSSKPSKVPEGYNRVKGEDALDHPNLIKSIG